VVELDTDILVRSLAKDDPLQSSQATELTGQRLTEENPSFLSIVAMVETVSVLDRAYGLTDDENAAHRAHAASGTCSVENEQEVFAAMIALEEGHGSFADALISGLGARAGCPRTLTFDQKGRAAGEL
jgi:predicted nucleic-acid-binding protein